MRRAAGPAAGSRPPSRRGRKPISMYRKRPFATRGRERRPARAVVCRIPCRILCLANVEQSSAGGTAFRTDGYQRYLGPCHQLKRVQTIDVVSMNDAVYSCTHKGCSRPQVGLQSHTISPAAAMNRPTKAGASTPATLDEQLARVGIIEARSTKAGASTPATRGAVGDRRGVLPRSTKAGASTPATPSTTSAGPSWSSTLNEGRSVNPGYTQSSTRPPQMPRTLNEGRSVNPGYTAKFCKRAVSGQTIARPRVREPRQRRVCVHFTRFRTIPRQNGRDQAVETALTAAKHTRFPRITEGSQISQSTQGWPSS